MRRMTLLTALALVFSLFTVTAAIAGPGPDSGEGAQTPNPVMKQDRDSVPEATRQAGVAGSECGDQAQTQTQTQEKEQVGECQADDCQTGEMTQTRTETQEKEQVGECQADDCQTGEMTQTKTQARTQTEAQLKECQADDCQGEEALMEREQIRQRVMNQILAMLGAEDAEVEGQYRLILNLMLQNMFRFGAMFI